MAIDGARRRRAAGRRCRRAFSGNNNRLDQYSSNYGDGLSCAGPHAEDASDLPFTGKERDAESGLDYFGARYLSSNFGRFMTPDWAATPASVPYASFDNPASLNLYAYVGNNPNTGIDLDGHFQQPENGVEVDQLEQDANAAQQDGSYASVAGEESSETGENDNSGESMLKMFENASAWCHGTCGFFGGFWSTLGQHLSNLLDGHSWNYGMGEPAPPNPTITAGTDIVGIITVTIHTEPVSVVNTIVSGTNNSSSQNLITNGLGLIPGYEGPMAITGAFNDLFDYGANNSTGTPTDTWKSEPLLGSGEDINGVQPIGNAQGGGGSINQEGCEVSGYC